MSDSNQLSIYDFLQDGELNTPLKSQEVAPSETLPQVDEAQDDWDRGHSQPVPSSALDTLSDINYKAKPKEIFEIPTEDTDLTLFSVGDSIKIRQASAMYNSDIDPESYYFIKDREGLEGTVVKLLGGQLSVSIGIDGEEIYVYLDEVIKI